MSKQGGVSRKKGLLLHGPPGTGKTLFAHAIAGVSTFRKGSIPSSLRLDYIFIGTGI